MRRALAGTLALALGARPDRRVPDAAADEPGRRRHGARDPAGRGHRLSCVRAQPVRHDGGRADCRLRGRAAHRTGGADDRAEGGCGACDLLSPLARARRHHRLAQGHQYRSAARAVRLGAGARRSDPAADRRQRHAHPHRARSDLSPAGDRMRRSGFPALGQPRRRAGASGVPGAGRAQPGLRVPCARHLARGRHHDAAGGDRRASGRATSHR